MKALRVLPAAALALGALTFLGAPAGADTHHGLHHRWWAHGRVHHGTVCTGTTTTPGVLTGTYAGSVTVKGLCVVNQGAATIDGNLVVAPGSAVVAAFGLDDATGSGNSSLTVKRDVTVRRGATLIMGCEPAYFTCLDDPGAQSGPGTLTSNGSIGGHLLGLRALAVIVHASTVGRDLVTLGGGYGNNCAAPTDSPSNSVSLSVWADIAKSAPYSDVEDTKVGGDVLVANLTSCWLGAARDTVARSVLLLHNRLNDPDAIEILANTVAGNLACIGNSSVWDSAEQSFGQTSLYPRTAEPNTVGGKRFGQCVLASPATQGGTSGPGPF